VAAQRRKPLRLLRATLWPCCTTPLSASDASPASSPVPTPTVCARHPRGLAAPGANYLNSFTRNIIKLYKPEYGESGSFAFVKRQRMHCVDPFCVAACLFHALEKDRITGVVSWTAEKCIGCRYCRIARPHQVPKFDWNAFNAKIVECEFCKERLAAGKEPACTYVCPTHAVIFAQRDILLRQAHRPASRQVLRKSRVRRERSRRNAGTLSRRSEL